MTGKELLYIKTIVDQGSISKAAKVLYVAQPSLSHCLQHIEETLGTKLFQRTSNGLKLTYAGERYYQTATEILRLYSDFEMEIGEVESLKKGSVTIGITSFLGTLLLPRVLPLFSASFPNIRVVLQEMASDPLETALNKQQIDFAVMHVAQDFVPSLDCPIQYRSFYRDPFVVVSKKDALNDFAKPNPDGGYPLIDLEKVIDQPFVMIEEGKRIREVTDNAFQRLNAVPNTVLTTKSCETARRLCAQGFGIMFTSAAYADMFRDQTLVSYYMIEEKHHVYWDRCIAIPKNCYTSQAAHALMRILLNECSH